MLCGRQNLRASLTLNGLSLCRLLPLGVCVFTWKYYQSIISCYLLKVCCESRGEKKALLILKKAEPPLLSWGDICILFSHLACFISRVEWLHNLIKFSMFSKSRMKRSPVLFFFLLWNVNHASFVLWNCSVVECPLEMRSLSISPSVVETRLCSNFSIVSGLVFFTLIHWFEEHWFYTI